MKFFPWGRAGERYNKNEQNVPAPLSPEKRWRQGNGGASVDRWSRLERTGGRDALEGGGAGYEGKGSGDHAEGRKGLREQRSIR